MRVKHLAWDSEFFGISVGRLDVEGARVDVPELQAVLRASGEAVVYVGLESSSERNDQCLAGIGAVKYDVRTVYMRTLPPHAALPGPMADVEDYCGPLTPELKALAIESGRYSRFRRDPRLNPHFERLYEEWMKASLEKSFADKVFVSRTEGVVSGVLTARVSEGRGLVGLLSVAPPFHGQGVGSRMLTACEGWYAAEKAWQSVIATQKDNQLACDWYSRRGYDVQSSQHVYHWWRDETDADATQVSPGAGATCA